jgi:methylenetetrahydrofolate dehydrogenase (NADP+)/methenyltetrahydrofolate cyclohydrolase
MPTILSGLTARDELKKPLAAKIKALQEKRSGSPLTLAIIQVGDRADSIAYINSKKKFAAEIGVDVNLINFQENINQEEIISEIKKLNKDKKITGIIVQLPLPKNLYERIILDAIDPAKDADAITSTNVKKWMIQKQVLFLYPATARGISELLDFYKISLKGKKVCVIGRSAFVGTPIACLCRAKGAIVTVCHSKTIDLVKKTLDADVIISAVGKAGLITAGHVRRGQVIIDVGLSRAEGKLVGDVDFEKVKTLLEESGAITPVPGGVGPMTVLALFENLLDCAILQVAGRHLN